MKFAEAMGATNSKNTVNSPISAFLVLGMASDVYNSEALSNNKYTYTGQSGNVITRYHTRCFFPEFKADMLQSIKEVIKSMGVNLLFSDRCDFSNLVENSVKCDDVKQAVKLEVTRSGIEGSAATIMEMLMAGDSGYSETVYEDVYEDFIVDKAFAYSLEGKYGNMLFAGIVNSVN